MVIDNSSTNQHAVSLVLVSQVMHRSTHGLLNSPKCY